ncbi:MAG: hypothetical protein JWR59_508 [Brevundimonas sp.]|nr:hypothetical protein [Brevundimonas sp.]
MNINLATRLRPANPVSGGGEAGVAPPSIRIELLSAHFPAGQRFDIAEDDCRHFLFVHSGTGSVELDATTHPLRPGSLVMTAPGRDCSIEMDAGAEGVWMSLSEVFFGSDVIRAMPGLAAHAVYWNDTYYKSEVSHFYEDDQHAPRRDQLFDELRATADRLGMGCDPAVSAYALVVLFGEQWRKINAAKRVTMSDARDLSEGQLVNHFRQMIGLNFTKHLRVQDYCDSMAISHDRLTNACKAVLGLTPTQTIQQRMVLEAKRALLHSSKSISQIGYDLGFSDIGYFSRFIRVRTGMSPRLLREQGAVKASSDPLPQTDGDLQEEAPRRRKADGR